jgi:peptidoglycan/xylan/chitin deacetylase (PgdA/CDA1 family)
VATLLLLGLALAIDRASEDGEPPPASTTTTATPPSTSSPTTTTTTTTVFPPTTSVPPPSGPAVPIRQGPSTEPIVALTFDAGSDTGNTAEILDTLAANHVRATFGLTGRWAEANPMLVRRIVGEGHQIVNHSYDHPSFTGRSTSEAPLSRAERLDQLARGEAAIRAGGGPPTPPWFRPPYGDEDETVRADIALAGYRYELLWTVDSLGWKGLAASSVVARCLDGAVPGGIFLFHVGAASTDHLALQPIIDGLRSRGYEFATASQLIA